LTAIEDKAFLFLLVVTSLAFFWIVQPFYGAVLWGAVIAILFAPLYRRLVRAMGQRRTLAALVTLAIILVMVILPVTLITVMLLQEAAGIYEGMQSGNLNFSGFFQAVHDALPGWAAGLLDRFGLTDIDAVRERLSAALMWGSELVATQVINIGQNTADFVIDLFVMLYLLFFLLRDGDALVRRIRNALPLHVDQQRALAEKFTTVVRATLKGTIIVALVQGALGGLIFWILGIQAALLWAVLMALLALLPAVGAALVWMPAAIYFLVTGAVWQGLVLMAWGTLVISVVDNVLRPILVGKDTKMPDYLVLISTLGGIAIFGIHGFVIGPLVAAMFLAAWDIFATARAREGRVGR